MAKIKRAWDLEKEDLPYIMRPKRGVEKLKDSVCMSHRTVRVMSGDYITIFHCRWNGDVTSTQIEEGKYVVLGFHPQYYAVEEDTFKIERFIPHTLEFYIEHILGVYEGHGEPAPIVKKIDYSWIAEEQARVAERQKRRELERIAKQQATLIPQEVRHYLDLELLWDNGEAIAQQALVIHFDDGSQTAAQTDPLGKVWMEQIPTVNYKVELDTQSEEQQAAELRLEIKNLLTDIVSKEEAEAERHQNQQDDMGSFDNATAHMGAFMWGLWNWGKNSAIQLKEISDLVNPFVRLNNTYKAAYKAHLSSPGKNWINSFADHYQEAELKELTEALGFDPTAISMGKLAEAYELTNFIMEDDETQENLIQFGKDYVSAQDSIELAEMSAPVSIEIVLSAIITAMTAGAGAAFLGAKAAGKMSKLGQKLIKLGKKLKAIRLKQNQVGKLGDQKQKIVVKRPDPQNIGVPKEVGGGSIGSAKIIPNRVVLTKAERLEIQQTLQTRADGIRAELPKKLRGSGNTGVAQLDIPGLPAEMKAHSRINYPTDRDADGFVHLADESDWTFKPKAVDPDNVRVGTPDAYTRQWDTEFKILNDVASRLGDNRNATGSINLFTERMTCTSCTDVIFDFKDRYPNIQLNVFSGE